MPARVDSGLPIGTRAATHPCPNDRCYDHSGPDDHAFAFSNGRSASNQPTNGNNHSHSDANSDANPFAAADHRCAC
ncbi:MAG: hypothetical protein AAF614_09765 [Chloroflexota bacterium]